MTSHWDSVSLPSSSSQDLHLDVPRYSPHPTLNSWVPSQRNPTVSPCPCPTPHPHLVPAPLLRGFSNPSLQSILPTSKDTRFPKRCFCRLLKERLVLKDSSSSLRSSKQEQAPTSLDRDPTNTTKALSADHSPETQPRLQRSHTLRPSPSPGLPPALL